MKPLFMMKHDVAELTSVKPLEGEHYTYCPAGQQAKWKANAPTMSTTQTFCGRNSISDDTNSDSE